MRCTGFEGIPAHDSRSPVLMQWLKSRDMIALLCAGRTSGISGARQGPCRQEAHQADTGTSVDRPVSVACAAKRTQAHPPLRDIGFLSQEREAGGMPHSAGNASAGKGDHRNRAGVHATGGAHRYCPLPLLPERSPAHHGRSCAQARSMPHHRAATMKPRLFATPRRQQRRPGRRSSVRRNNERNELVGKEIKGCCRRQVCLKWKQTRLGYVRLLPKELSSRLQSPSPPPVVAVQSNRVYLPLTHRSAHPLSGERQINSNR